MPIATNKAALRQDIKEAYRRLRPLLGGFSPSQLHAPLLEGQCKGMMMSPHDLLAYLVGWAELVLSWRRRWLAEGRIQQIPVSGFGRMARHFYSLHAALPHAALLSRLDDAVVDVLAMVDGCSEEELYGTVWYTARSSGRTYTFGRLVQMNTAAPYRNARSRIGRWKKRAARRATASAPRG